MDLISRPISQSRADALKFFCRPPSTSPGPGNSALLGTNEQENNEDRKPKSKSEKDVTDDVASEWSLFPLESCYKWALNHVYRFLIRAKKVNNALKISTVLTIFYNMHFAYFFFFFNQVGLKDSTDTSFDR